MAARVDYEGAWDDLQATLLTRDGWGTRAVIQEMAELRLRHRLPDAPAAVVINGVRYVPDETIPEGPTSTGSGTTPTDPRAGCRANEDPEEDRDGDTGPHGAHRRGRSHAEPAGR